MAYPRLSDVINTLADKELYTKLAAAQDELTRAPKSTPSIVAKAQSSIKAPGDEELADNHYQMAKAAFDDGKLLVAWQEAELVLKLNEGHIEATELVKKINEQSQQVSSVPASFNPKNTARHYIAALKFYQSGELVKADEEIRLALANNSGWESAQKLLAEVRQQITVEATVAAPKNEPKKQEAPQVKKLDQAAKFAEELSKAKEGLKKAKESNDPKLIKKFETQVERFEGLLKNPEKLAKEKEKEKTATFAKLGVNKEEDKLKLKEYLEKTQNNQVGKQLFGDGFTSKADGIFNGKSIVENFEKLNQQFKYFDDQDKKLQEIYQQFYQACYYNWTVIEQNPNPEEVHQYAYKYMAVFLEYKKDKTPEENLRQLSSTLDKFIGEHAGNINKPLHDLMSTVSLPAYKGEDGKTTFDLPAWQKLIRENGPKVLKRLSHAPRIASAPKDYAALTEAITHLTYPRGKEAPELAGVYLNYSVDERRFNRTLDYIKDGALKNKDSDHLPSIVIDVAQEVIGAESRKNYYFMRLPAGDPRGFILGDITNCCQSIGGESEQCAIDGSSRDNNGFYVLIKTNKPLDDKTLREYENNPAKQREFWKGFEERGNEIYGQGYVWRSKAGNLVIDSWENLTPTRDDPWMKPILENFSTKLIAKDKSISRVTIGTGGKTPVTLKEMTALEADLMLEGYQYGDSTRQALVMESPELIKARDALKVKLEGLGVENIPDLKRCVSIEQIAMLNSLSDKLLRRLASNVFFDIKLSSYGFMPRKVDAEVYFNSLLDISEKDPEKFALLIYNDAYKTGGASVSDLVALDKQKISLLISKPALNMYKDGLLKASDLATLDYKKIKLLLSNDANSVYKTGSVTVSDLAPLDNEKIGLLISGWVRPAYKTGGVKASDLAPLDYQKIILLTSSKAMEAYETSGVKASDLVGLTREEITEIFATAIKTGKLDEALSFDNSNIDLSAFKQLNKCISHFDTSKLSDQFLEDLHKKSSTILSQPKTSETASKYSKAEEMEQIYAKILKQREIEKMKAPSSSQISR
jgi:hypothetical protein